MFSQLRDKNLTVSEKIDFLKSTNFGKDQQNKYINPESEILTWLLNQTPITATSLNVIIDMQGWCVFEKYIYSTHTSLFFRSFYTHTAAHFFEK